MNGRYIEKNGVPVAEPDLLKWGNWLEAADRQVANHEVGDERISTVFLGLDHSFVEGAIPILYETMVFGGPLDGEMERYATRTGALYGHAKMLKRARLARAD